jgi:hypothetical protein
MRQGSHRSDRIAARGFAGGNGAIAVTDSQGIIALSAAFLVRKRMSNIKKTAEEQATDPAFHREEFPFYWIVNVYARYTQIMEITLKKAQLDVSGFRVLMVTHQYGKASISQISEYAMAKMPTVTKIVGRLRGGWSGDHRQ